MATVRVVELARWDRETADRRPPAEPTTAEPTAAEVAATPAVSDRDEPVAEPPGIRATR
jgi:hypothetical protein